MILIFVAIGRVLIPRYFRSMFEGGVCDLYFILRHQRESFHTTLITLDCEQALMVTLYGKPMFTKVGSFVNVKLKYVVKSLIVWHCQFANLTCNYLISL